MSGFLGSAEHRSDAPRLRRAQRICFRLNSRPMRMRFYMLPTNGPVFPKIQNRYWDGMAHGGGGTPEVLREKAFAAFCRKSGFQCIRTLDLFRLLALYRHRILPKFHVGTLKAIWRYRVSHYRYLLSADVVEILGSQHRKLSGDEKMRWLGDWHPHPGSWHAWYANSKRTYQEMLQFLTKASGFWKLCPIGAKRAICRCRRYSKRIPEAHPDYFVVFSKSWYGFVEVKGFRESMRPSQQRFFPELVLNARQRIWVARINPDGGTPCWFAVGAKGRLRLGIGPQPPRLIEIGGS